jgi:hypothetical protein
LAVAGLANIGPRAYVATGAKEHESAEGPNLSAQEPSENELLTFVGEQLASASEQHIREALDGNRVEWVRRYRLEQLGIASPDGENDPDSFR